MPSRNTYHLTWGFSYLGRGVSLHGCPSKAQPLLLTLDKGYLLTATPPDLERGIVPLGSLACVQPPLLGHGVAPPGHRPGLGHGVVPPGRCPWRLAWGSSSQLPPLTSDVGYLLSAPPALSQPDTLVHLPDLGHGCSSSWPPPLTLDKGLLLLGVPAP